MPRTRERSWTKCYRIWSMDSWLQIMPMTTIQDNNNHVWSLCFQILFQLCGGVQRWLLFGLQICASTQTCFTRAPEIPKMAYLSWHSGSKQVISLMRYWFLEKFCCARTGTVITIHVLHSIWVEENAYLHAFLDSSLFMTQTIMPRDMQRTWQGLRFYTKKWNIEYDRHDSLPCPFLSICAA